MTARTVTDTPKQWRLVPVEPTPKMVNATWDHAIDRDGGVESQNTRNARIWSAMCAASPAPDLEGLRERVARGLYSHNAIVEKLWVPDQTAPYPDAVRWNDEAALAMADAVLALIFTPEGEGRE